MSRVTLLLATTGLMLAACASDTGPPVEALTAPVAWTTVALPAAAPELERWWTALGDPRLDALVAQAGEASDVRLAEARLFEARARLGAARAALRPTLGAEGSLETRTVDDLDQDTFEALVAFSIAPDLNGAGRARIEAGRRRAEAGAARVEAARLAARATAVRLHAALGEARARADAGDRAVAALEQALQLAEARERAGLTSGLDAAAARAALAAARTRPITARQAAAEAQLGLEALLGLAPGALTHTLAEARPTAAAPPLRALAAPAAVLARRPDLRAAELELWAAGVDADAARRDFWPTVSLAAALGGREVDPTTPFTASGFLAQVAGGLSAPLFSFGRLESARDAADARQRQAAIAYRQAAIDALAGVETALVGLASAEARAATLEDAAEAARTRASLATRRYRAGVSPFLEVLDAERSLAEAEADLAGARGETLAAWASLHAAAGLGGQP
ncbi:MAG: efflux transporter outer membrane subunit [Brevundimonas sp.]|uniref:efflux transporter outer membrane subunit n=3 Tax=Brevundimonas sp. TaxID=1871086 RepID=UPI003919F095